jgi:Peptidase family S41
MQFQWHRAVVLNTDLPTRIWIGFLIILLITASLACNATARSSRSGTSMHSSLLVKEAFERSDAMPWDWFATIPDLIGATADIEEGAARLRLPLKGEIKLSRILDAVTVRGQRLRVSARVRSDSSSAAAQISVRTDDAAGRNGEQIHQEPVTSDTWEAPSFVVDIAPESQRVELGLLLRGTGNAWFDDVEVEILGSSPPQAPVTLSSWQISSIEALARTVALVRYRHPSDQSAKLDWNTFLPGAVDRMLRAKGRDAVRAALQELFEPIAPTVELSDSSTYSLGEPPRGAAGHFTRWRHAGLGTGSPYVSWRDGRDIDPASIRFEVLADTPSLSRCKMARLEATGHRLGDGGDAVVYADIGLPGDASKQTELKLGSTESTVSTSIEMPVDAYNLRLGVKAAGRAGFSLSKLTWTCGDQDRVEVDVSRASWLRRGDEDLYTHAVANCAPGQCLVVERRPLETSFVASRDVIHAAIGDRLWIHVPVAVWTDGNQTFPEGDIRRSASAYTPTDVSTRLAIIVSAWATASLFYPFFVEQQIDWAPEIARGLVTMSAARSLSDIYWALSSHLAALHDNHGRVYHPSLSFDGVLPVALRRFDNTLMVVGALDSHAKRLPVGTEVLAIDQVPALQAYDQMARRTPASTRGWSDMVVPYWLTLGASGTLSTMRVRTPDGKTDNVVLPRLSRALYDSSLRERRPAFGAELSAGVYYVDLERMKREQWATILPSLSKARAIILDMRGYPSGVTPGLLGHLCDREIRSPEWQIPMLGTGGYKKLFWTIRPMKPKLDARAIVLLDGRAGSAAETVLQIVKDNRLAILVGESSAGANGNVTLASLPGGFSMRFTGMRVPLADGTALQGRGIAPDHIVRPTLEGMRAGRDEILEAALALASRP